MLRLHLAALLTFKHIMTRQIDKYLYTEACTFQISVAGQVRVAAGARARHWALLPSGKILRLQTLMRCGVSPSHRSSIVLSACTEHLLNYISTIFTNA
jgi:hypothetical protein